MGRVFLFVKFLHIYKARCWQFPEGGEAAEKPARNTVTLMLKKLSKSFMFLLE